jgi:hypothetical protein
VLHRKSFKLDAHGQHCHALLVGQDLRYRQFIVLRNPPEKIQCFEMFSNDHRATLPRAISIGKDRRVQSIPFIARLEM